VRDAHATDAADEVGARDLVILADKSHHLPTVAARAPPRVHQDTAFLNTQNGMLWWYFHDSLLDAVADLGELTGTPPPCLKMVNARATLPDKTLQDTSACLRALSGARDLGGARRREGGRPWARHMTGTICTVRRQRVSVTEPRSRSVLPPRFRQPSARLRPSPGTRFFCSAARGAGMLGLCGARRLSTS
jgi:hypothetical protein